MDLFALQMTPRKKEEKKIPEPEKVQTQAQANVAPSPDGTFKKSFGSFISKIVPHDRRLAARADRAEQQISADAGDAEKNQKQNAHEELEQKKTEIAQEVAAPKSEVVPIRKVVKVDLQKMNSPFAEAPLQVKKEARKQSFSPNFKLLQIGEKKAKKQEVEKVRPTAAKIEKKEIALQKEQQNLLEKFVIASIDFDEEKVRVVLEQLAELRSEKTHSSEDFTAFNMRLKQKMLGGISAHFAYGKSKNIISVFELLDTLGIEFDQKDLAAVPDEVLKSPEMHAVVIRYLLAYAKKFQDSPVDLEKKIATFSNCGIILTDEMFKQEDLTEIVEKNLLNFARDNQKNPLEIERRIFQYSLVGLLDGASFKKNPKLRMLMRGAIFDLLGRNPERIEDSAKKLQEYEHAGLALRSELRADEKIQKLLEKYFMHFIGANIGHQRKIAARIKEYSELGLISNQAREDFLKLAKNAKR
jgi:hypothetical protein